MMSNIDSILGRKNSTYYFEEESDNGISENECFKNEEDKILDRKKSNKSKIINKASSKKTLNILLNKKIISKEQSTLLSFKSINEGLFNSGNLLDIKKNMNNVNLSQRQNKKQFSFILKSDDII